MIKISALCVYFLSSVLNAPIHIWEDKEYYRIYGDYQVFQNASIQCISEIENKLKKREIKPNNTD